MASPSSLPCGQFRTSYAADNRLYPTRFSLALGVLTIVVFATAPQWASPLILALLIQIGYMGVGALGLNILVGYTGQISLGHAAFFGFGAFASAWLSSDSSRYGFHLLFDGALVPIPVVFAIPLAGVMTAAVGLVFGIPAARIKGLYLAIATLAAQIIIEDFFSRAAWFTGGAAGGVRAETFSVFGFLEARSAEQYFYVVLVFVVLLFVLASNLLRTRDGRAFVAVRDHYLSAEVMGINLTKYRILAFGISAFFAGVAGALYAHYIRFVSIEQFTILKSIEFLAMIIIGGLGSVRGSLLGAAFIVLLPHFVELVLVDVIGGTLSAAGVDISGMTDTVAFVQQAAIGLTIVLFLMFEPNGLAYRWRLIKSYWKLYPFSY